MNRVKTLLVLAVLFLTPATTMGATDVDASWRITIERLQLGLLTLDAQEVRNAAMSLRAAALASVPADQLPLLNYTLAYAYYGLYQISAPAEGTADLLDEAARLLEEAIAIDDHFAEAYALLASVYGTRIGAAGWKALFMGFLLVPRYNEAIERAVALEPRNPRIVLQKGIGALYTPRIAGGGNARAEALLRTAVQLFDEESPGHPWPNWGRERAHAWLGIVLEKRGDTIGAGAEYKKALRLSPQDRWVREVLLPRLD